MPYVSLAEFDFPTDIEDAVPAQYAELYRAVPLMLYKQALVVGVDETLDMNDTVKSIEFITGRHVEAARCKPEDIDKAIDHLFSAEELVGLGDVEAVPEESKEIELLKQQVREKPIVRIVTRMLIEAYRKNASDIHIRPTENGAKFLLRINGNMVERSDINRENVNAVVSRFKILGGMNIAEHRQPQDGGAKIAVGGNKLELRLSILPTIHGESLVVRLLNADKQLFTLPQLGLGEGEYKHVYKASKQSHGLVLVVGPTGSGKSTTLYAMLQEIRQNKALNIITVEDPVEFHIDDTEQIQINTKAGATFPKTLRNILRHDPDVIMVGEIRDEETAKIAIESALTGHLVLSTLHSVNAVSSITRLLEMGVKPYLLKSTLSLVIAQRLAKTNCPQCLDIDNSQEAAMLNEQTELSHITFKAGKGCDHCNFTGVEGRIGIYEALPIDSVQLQTIHEDVTETELVEIARRRGFVALSKHAIELAEQGKISAREWIQLQVS